MRKESKISSAAFYTLGCKLNYAETSEMGKEFIGRGFDIVDFADKADVYVINTCTVTANADRECRQIVRRALRNNPDAYVIVTGCYAQLRSEEIASIEGVDAVLGSNAKFNIFNYLPDFSKSSPSCIHIDAEEERNSFHFSSSAAGDERTRAFFKIQDGCDYKCTFCTIPLARGGSRSMPPDEVVPRLEETLAKGYKEIILTGVNVGDYGKGYNTSLYETLKKMIAVPGEFRIRISSIEPNLLTDEIIELAASNSKICSHFHIPLQSGSPEILAAMKRRYNRKHFEERIKKIKELIPFSGIGIDVITGFPGETEKHFNETYDFLRDIPFSYLHVFSYSERDNTPAASMKQQVETAERKKRNNMLRILSEKKRTAFYREMKGKKLETLFENEEKDGFTRGFSSNYVRIEHPYEPGLINKLVKVEITGVHHDICTASFQQNNFRKNIAG